MMITSFIFFMIMGFNSLKHESLYAMCHCGSTKTLTVQGQTQNPNPKSLSTPTLIHHCLHLCCRGFTGISYNTP